MTPSTRASHTMSDEHKAALAEGRTQSRAVKAYLEALQSNRPKRGRKRTTESMRSRLEELDLELADAAPLKRVLLIQERLDLEEELNADSSAIDLAGLEKQFLAAAKGYSERKGISYAAWREMGLSPSVLAEAGIQR